MHNHEIYTECNQSAGIMAMWDDAQMTYYDLNDGSTMFVISMTRFYGNDEMVSLLHEANLTFEDVITTNLF